MTTPTPEQDTYGFLSVANADGYPDEGPNPLIKNGQPAEIDVPHEHGAESLDELSPNVRERYGLVAVRDLCVQCSLQVRNFNSIGVCMSDCCGRTATTAVEMVDGKKMWRCDDHKGIRNLSQGRVFTQILRKKYTDG